jgi:Family of unknown function (DUF6551)
MATATMTDETELPGSVKTELIPIGKIQRDERVNTRPVNEAWVRARIDIFDPLGLGVPLVSRRADGTCVVLNGQNRIALAKACGYTGGITCQILEGQTLFEEAKMFVMHNDDRKLTPVQKFLARITQEEPIALAIEAAVDRAGWEISPDPGPGVITAVSTLEQLWKRDRRHHPDDQPFVVANTLQSITLAWAHAPHASHEAIIKGIGYLYVRHGLIVDVQHMANRLAAYPGGAAKLLINSRGLKDFKGGAVAHSVAELVTDEYNKDRPPKRLPKYR